MAELNTIARPYAVALFRLAKESGTLQQWSALLAKLQLIAQDPQVKEVVANPQFSSEKIQSFVLDLLGEEKNEVVENFLAEVLANRRFVVLPEIGQMYEALKAASENQIDAKIESAFALSDAQLADLVEVLSQQFQGQVKAEVSVNDALIGGVKITLGDLVVDASVQGKLAALSATMKSYEKTCNLIRLKSVI